MTKMNAAIHQGSKRAGPPVSLNAISEAVITGGRDTKKDYP
jgi:hypothetical protein